ncbi:MAG: hypothetical protein ACLUCH_08180 [Lachnospirales bacterium]
MSVENVHLTKNAKKVLKKSYKLYLHRKKLNENSPDYILDTDLPQIPRDDFLSAANEICKNNLAKRYHSSFKLNSNAILYMENRLKTYLLKISKFILKNIKIK